MGDLDIPSSLRAKYIFCHWQIRAANLFLIEYIDWLCPWTEKRQVFWEASTIRCSIFADKPQCIPHKQKISPMLLTLCSEDTHASSYVFNRAPGLLALLFMLLKSGCTTVQLQLYRDVKKATCCKTSKLESCSFFSPLLLTPGLENQFLI